MLFWGALWPACGQQNGRLRAAGSFEEAHGDWRVIRSSDQGSNEVENQSVRIWLAWGYGPIHAEKTKGDTRTGGDFLRN